jgi:hypothetical protein
MKKLGSSILTYLDTTRKELEGVSILTYLGIVFVSYVILFMVPHVLGWFRVYQAAHARAVQATQEEVTRVATTFVQNLGYTVRGPVQCRPSRFDGSPPHYQCYVVFDLAQHPLVLACGRAQPTDTLPLHCTLVMPSWKPT